MQTRHGFTLIEFSIVLAIIGPVTGGVIAGSTPLRGLLRQRVSNPLRCGGKPEYDPTITVVSSRLSYESLEGYDRSGSFVKT